MADDSQTDGDSIERTQVRVRKETREEAKKHKGPGETWDDYLKRCTEQGQPVLEVVDAQDALAGIGGDGLTYDDVKAAVSAALEEQLPEEVQQR
jgi:hypothetical protein